MRRRNLLGGNSIEYVFSAQSTSVSVGYNSSSTYVNITSTANGSNIGYSVVSYDGTVVTSVATAATSVTIYYSDNSTFDQRSGNVVLKQDDSNKTITISVSQSAHPLDLGYEGILLDGANNKYGYIEIGSEVSFSNEPSWATVTYLSSGYIRVATKSSNNASTARTATITISAGSQSTSLTIIQLPNNYHSRGYITIGGLNWAIKNVGASSVKDDGNYYMYGKGSRVYTYGDSMYEGIEDPLDSSLDTATQVMGSGWRMPTENECRALTGNSSYYWVSYNNVNGCVFNSNGNVLFFPAAGWYNDGSLRNYGNVSYLWSSTPINKYNAYYMLFYSGRRLVYEGGRHAGYPVRGVQS